MKILIVRPTPNKVNLNTYNLQEIGLAKALIRKGHTCDVMYYTDEASDYIETINFEGNLKLNIRWTKGKKILREGIYPSLKKIVNDYDIIQVGGYIGLTSYWLNKHYSHKTVNYQGPYYYKNNRGDITRAKIWDNTLLKLLDKKTMLVGTKSILATEYVKSKGIENVTTIGVGLDLDNLNCDNDTVEIKDEWVNALEKNKGNNKYILYIGVFEDRRNIEFTLRVFANILTKDSGYRLVLVGKGKQEYEDKCNSLIQELGIGNKIIRSKRVEQKYIRNVYNVSDIFILPTKYEIFGMVLLESMYFGVPVITSYNGGSSTLMNDQNGIVLNNFDTDEWADKIIELTRDKESYNKVRDDARDCIENNYTWDALSHKFVDLYNRRLATKD